MKRSIYLFGIFILGLSILCGLFQTFIHVRVGNPMYLLQPFAEWYLVINIIFLIGSIVVLKYLHFKKFVFAFAAGTIGSLLMLCYFIFIYISLISVSLKFGGINAAIFILFLVANISFALSLIYSKAGKNPWLKAAGILTFFNYIIFGSVFIISLVSREFFSLNTLENVQQWSSLIGSLVPMLFVIIFCGELMLLEQEETYTGNTYLENALGVFGITAIVASFSLGILLAQEAHWAIDWNEKGPEKKREFAKAFETGTFVGANEDTLYYLLLKPKGFDSDNEYPIVVCLHGAPVPVDNVEAGNVEVPMLAQLLSSAGNRAKYPAYIFVPQSPPGHAWGGVPGLPKIDSLVFETMQALEREYKIDAHRRYVAGESMGGYGAWFFIGSRPKMFAAAIPFCGSGDPQLAQYAVDVPVWAFHGAKDRNVSVNGSRDMIAAMKKAGGNPLYTEYPGAGHHIWPQISETPGLLEWLFAQSKK